MPATLYTARCFDVESGFTTHEQTFSTYEEAEQWATAQCDEADCSGEVQWDFEVEMNTYA